MAMMEILHICALQQDSHKSHMAIDHMKFVKCDQEMQLFILTNLNRPMRLAASVLAAGLDIQKNRHRVNTVNTYLEIKHIFGLSGKKLNKKIK